MVLEKGVDSEYNYYVVYKEVYCGIIEREYVKEI